MSRLRFLALVVLALLAGVSFAQVTGRISGVVLAVAGTQTSRGTTERPYETREKAA